METKQRTKPRSAKPSDNRTGQKKAAPAARNTNRKRTAPKPEQPKITQDVVYLAPKPFSRNRMILRLATVAAVVVALVLGMSVFFKVEEFSISGTEKYTPRDIYEACGIREGDNLLLLNRTEAGGKIIAALPYVKSARVGIKLPGTVHIEIVELDVTYAIKDAEGSWWLISAAGTVVESLPETDPVKYTKILGVQLKDPQAGKAAVALENQQPQTDAEGNTIPVTVTAADRLETAIDIMGFLEGEDVVGEAASIDVNNMGDIQIWYGDKYQVKLGNHQDLGSKISVMMNAIRSLQQTKPYEHGVLNVADLGSIYFDSFE